MSEVKVYLSHGGGVNSWALYLWLMDQGEVPGEGFEAVFVDHGTDWPETYEYMNMMIGRGYPVTVIKPDIGGISSLYDYCLKYTMIPRRNLRWCTEKFKVKTISPYIKRPCIETIGFDVDEDHRRLRMVGKAEVEQDFPLIAAGIDRGGCVDIIKRHGLPVPKKSGCYICPFQGRKQWIELREKHPDLFCKAKHLEELCNERRAVAGKKLLYFRDRPLDELIQVKDSRGRLAVSGQQEMFDDHDRPPCRCGL